MSTPTFRSELKSLINRYSKENGSNTPDFILAGYLIGSLEAFNATVTEREAWYGRPKVLHPQPLPPRSARLVYLCGAMAGKMDEECNGWRNRATELLGKHDIGTLNPMVRDLRGVDVDIDQARQLVRDDKDDIRRSWAVLVKADVGASWGTAMEVLFASDCLNDKHIVAIVGSAPVSPWVFAHATVIAENLEDACAALAELSKQRS